MQKSTATLETKMSPNVFKLILIEMNKAIKSSGKNAIVNTEVTKDNVEDIFGPEISSLVQ